MSKSKGHIDTILLGIVCGAFVIWAITNADRLPSFAFRWILLVGCTAAAVGQYVLFCRTYLKFVWFWLDLVGVLILHCTVFVIYLKSTQHPNFFTFTIMAFFEVALLVVLVERHADKAGVPPAR